MKKLLSFAIALMMGGMVFAQDATWETFNNPQGWFIASTDTVFSGNDTIINGWNYGQPFDGSANYTMISRMSFGQSSLDAHFLYSPIFKISSNDTANGRIEFTVLCAPIEVSEGVTATMAQFSYALVEVGNNNRIIFLGDPNGNSVKDANGAKTITIRFNDQVIKDSNATFAAEGSDYRFMLVHTGTRVLGSIDSNTSAFAALIMDDFIIRKRADAFVVKFDAGEGTGTMADMVTTEGGNLTAPTCTFTAPTGKEFTCWYAYEYIEDSLYEYCIPAGDPVEAISNDMVWTAVYAETEGIENAAMSTLSIYPNPAKDMVNVNGVSVNTLEVIDMAGRVVMKNEGKNAININKLSNGVYTLRINAAEGMAVRKIVKK